MRKKISLVLSFLVVLGVFAGCTSGKTTPTSENVGSKSATVSTQSPQAAVGSKKTDLVLANNAEPTSVDPQEVQDTTTIPIFRHLYARLIKQDVNLNYVGELAKKWEFTNDTSLKFYLRDDAKFSDGSNITARDVKFTIERAQNSARVKQFVEMITNVEIINDYEFVMHTDEPCGPLLGNLCHTPMCIVSEKYVTENGDQAFKKPLSSGALVLEEWKSGDYLKLVPNEYYFDRDKVQLTSLLWRNIPEGSARTIALETGEVDIVLNLDAIDASKVEDNNKLKLYEGISNQIEYLAMNMKEGSPFTDVRVREAFNYAIDKDAVLLVACEGRGLTANSVLLPGFPGYVEFNAGHDPDKAKALLKEAGYDETNPFTFKLKTSGAARVREAELVQASLAEVGVKMSIETSEWATFLDETMKGDFDAYIMGVNFNVGDTDFVADGYFHSRQIGISSNRFAFRNARVDELVTKGKFTVDPKKREEYYTEALSIVANSFPWVPLFTKSYLTGTQAELQGYVQHPLFMEEYFLLHY